MIRLYGLLLVILFVGQSLAQDRVTDVELQAAYCYGVATDQLEKSSAELADARVKAQGRNASPADRGRLKALQDVEPIIRERRGRFRDYLETKGFLQGRDMQSIRNALLRGPPDNTACVAEAKEPRTVECMRKCGPIRTSQDMERCDVQCGSEACVRTKRCLEQFLPF
jgi:hypothetical protein